MDKYGVEVKRQVLRQCQLQYYKEIQKETTMNKRERVIAAIKGEKVDKVPSSFSLHFSNEEGFGQKGVDAHIKFFKETDTDIIKIMNENLVPSIYNIQKPEDWNQLKKLSIRDEFIVRQIDLVKRILDKAEDNVFSIGTLHGSVASVLHAIEDKYGYKKGREIITAHMRENSKPLLDAFSHITDIMEELAQKYIELGLDGVYLAILGETQYFTEEEFANNIQPFDKQILSAVKEKNGYNVLHICKDNIDLNRYKSYEDLIDVLNWGIYEGGVTLGQGRRIFPNTTILGGLENKSSVFAKENYEGVKKKVKSIIEEVGGKRFILGADCTLPPDTPYERIRQVLKAVEDIK